MADLFDYLYWRGDLAVQNDPFNEIDALILARLSYAPFDRIGLDSESGSVCLGDAAAKLLEYPGIEKAALQQEDLKLWQKLASSARFAPMLLQNYVSEIDPSDEKQFAAVTIRPEGAGTVIAYRGTDNTLVGWKENFNMTFLFPVPAQQSALTYLEKTAAAGEGPLILCGHSKGGNLAMYAAAFCSAPCQARISAVFNFDGPGFEAKVLAEAGYKAVCAKISTFVPQESIVGMLLEHDEKYIVVESAQKVNYLQHDVYSWQTGPAHLCYLDEVAASSRLIDRVLTDWLAELEVSERSALIDALYSLLSETDARTFRELEEELFKNGLEIFSSYKTLDEPTKKLMADALGRLLKNVRKGLEQRADLKHPKS